MDTIESERRHFKIITSYLSTVGIWPYQKKYTQYFLRTIVYIVMVSCISAQISYVVCFFTIETLTNMLFMICTCSIALVKHYICAAKGSKVINYILYSPPSGIYTS
ncbi:uncharacterized protein LOC143264195 [Megachile rotundata]|uniref:uncharacterized protein LOC143264195 n=1 Tax=Megachile rotundata TaxID=143995 RepID=UPI003FD48771